MWTSKCTERIEVCVCGSSFTFQHKLPGSEKLSFSSSHKTRLLSKSSLWNHHRSIRCKCLKYMKTTRPLERILSTESFECKPPRGPLPQGWPALWLLGMFPPPGSKRIIKGASRLPVRRREALQEAHLAALLFLHLPFCW